MVRAAQQACERCPTANYVAAASARGHCCLSESVAELSDCRALAAATAACIEHGTRSEALSAQESAFKPGQTRETIPRYSGAIPAVFRRYSDVFRTLAHPTMGFNDGVARHSYGDTEA